MATTSRRGFLTHPAVGDSGWSWGTLGYVVSGAAAGLGTGDALIDLVYALAAPYRAGASFVMNSRTAGAVRKLKDADGRHLWSDGFAAGEPARLLGYPVLIAEDMPDIAADAFPVAFGDFSRATPSRSVPTCGCCAIRSAPSRTSSSTPPSASAATCQRLRGDQAAALRGLSCVTSQTGAPVRAPAPDQGPGRARPAENIA